MKHPFLIGSFLLFGFHAQSQVNKIEPTGKVGIGTTTPTELLEIADDGPAVLQLKRRTDDLGAVGTIKFNLDGTEVGKIESERVLAVGRESILKFFVWGGGIMREGLRINNAGDVGIGSVAPSQKLDVAGYIRSAPSAVEGGLYLGNANHGLRRPVGTNNVELFTTQGNIFLSASSVSGNQLVLRENGDVEMGAPGISSKLTVNGKLTATKVKVSQNVWADFVFEPTYILPSLYDLELYVKKYKHLPEIPSAKEVQEQGLDLGANQAKLLQKIEELTLYVIEQHKQLQAQQKTLTEQGEIIKDLKKKLHD